MFRDRWHIEINMRTLRAKSLSIYRFLSLRLLPLFSNHPLFPNRIFRSRQMVIFLGRNERLSKLLVDWLNKLKLAFEETKGYISLFLGELLSL